MTLLVIFVHNDDPYAKWAVLAIGYFAGAVFAFGIPAILSLSGTTCYIAVGGVGRNEVPPNFRSFVQSEYYRWEWDAIGRLRLASRTIDGRTYPILEVWDKNGELLGFVGLNKRITVEDVAAWAEAKQCTFEDVGTRGGLQPEQYIDSNNA